jgi:hypothetical protein
MTSEERWLAIPGSDGYEVSDHGRVRSIPRVLVYANGRRYRKKGRILRPVLNTVGYLKVSPGKSQTRTVHELVLAAFRGPKPPGTECRHLNDAKTDNRLENLEYGTRSENMYDAVRNGRNRNALQTRCLRGHTLTGDNVKRNAAGQRRCRECIRTNARASYQRRKATAHRNAL